MSWRTGSGSALNQLAEETLYHLFRLALGSPSLASSDPAPAGSLKDDREMRGVATAGLKGLLHPLHGYSNQGFISAMLAVIWRRLYFSLGTLVKSFSYPKKVAEQFLRLRAIRVGEKELFRVLKLGMARRGRKSIYSSPRSS